MSNKLLTNMSQTKSRIATLFLISLISLSTSLMAAPLTVVGFGGTLQKAQRNAYFIPFEKLTGEKVVEDSYLGGYAKQKVMVETNNVTWDVVQMDENEMIAACDQGLLEKIDTKKLTNYAEISDGVTPCGVGAIVWSMMSTYNPKQYGTSGPKNWKEFWNIKKWPGKRGLRKQARQTLEIALLADGVMPKDIYTVLGTKEGQDRAFKKLDEIKDNIVWWESGAQPLDWLKSGIVSATAAYNGRIFAANNEGENLPMSWSGQLYNMGYWTIVKGTKNKHKAYDLLNFMNKAENQKAFVEKIPYGVINKQVKSMLTKSTINQLPNSEQNILDAVHLDSYFWLDHEEELQQRFTRWVSQG
ncbi:ABC transporter substrate-binding protein [Vibrio sp. Vb339]|uniref:ABC transporter substrate-binding protein n=1 Tax=Vibrio sp. Vb339 TaxID=1192013 RepID=UPI001C1323E7|nr:ABC transporter substrate-binding protein [Vibrio sp. Vb339]